jgi:hypothetical protein
MKILVVLATGLLAASVASAQLPSPISFSGYSFNTIHIEGAERYGEFFKTNRFFSGTGPYAGGALEFGRRFMIDAGTRYFEGWGVKGFSETTTYKYHLKAIQVPVNFSFLLRDRDKKFNIAFGSGFQYVQARLQQYDFDATDPSIHLLINDLLTRRIAANFTYEMRLQVWKSLQLKYVLGFSAIGNFSATANFLVQYKFGKNLLPVKIPSSPSSPQ